MEAKEPPPKRKVLGRVKRYVRRSTLLHHHQQQQQHGDPAAAENPGGAAAHQVPDAESPHAADAAAPVGFDTLPAEARGSWQLPAAHAARGTRRPSNKLCGDVSSSDDNDQVAKKEKRLENALMENDDIIPLISNALGDSDGSSAALAHSVDDGEDESEPEESEEHSMIWHRAGEIDWRARYKATYDVPKAERKRDTIVVRLDTTVFTTAAGALDPPISGEVVLNVASHRIVTHGIYVVVSGKEFHSAGAGRYQRTVRSSIMNVALCVSDSVQFSQRHERKVVYEHGTHRLPFRVTARALAPPTFCRTAQQLYYSTSYKLRGVIAYPRLHTDYWTPKHAHRLTVLPSPRFEQSLLAKHRHIPGRSVTTYLNGLVKITISLQRTGFYLGEPIQMQVDVDNGSPMDFHFLVVTAVEQMRSPVLRDSFTTVTLPRHDRKQRMKERMAKHAEGEEDGDRTSVDSDEDDTYAESHQHQVGRDEEEEEGTAERRSEAKSEREEGERTHPPGSSNGKHKRKSKHKKATLAQRPEKWFAAEILKGQRSTHNVEFTIEEDDTNGPPWNVPHSAYVEQRYVLHAKIRRKEGRSLILGALEPSADSAPVVFVSPPHDPSCLPP